jgi:hypothetical protein
MWHHLSDNDGTDAAVYEWPPEAPGQKKADGALPLGVQRRQR